MSGRVWRSHLHGWRSLTKKLMSHRKERLMLRVAAVKTGRSEAGGQVGELGGGFSRQGWAGHRRKD